MDSKKRHVKILNDNLFNGPESSLLKYSLKPRATSFNGNLSSDVVCHNRQLLNLDLSIEEKKWKSEIKNDINYLNNEEQVCADQENYENEDLNLTTELEWDLHEDLGRIRDVG